MFNKEIKAANGCIIYFPGRKNASKQPFLIKGSDRTFKKNKEVWVQIRANEIIALEDRKEGDNAANLGNSLYCEIVSKIKIRINQDYEKSIPLVTDRLLCTPSSDLNQIVNSSYFSEQLKPSFVGVIQKVIKNLNYLELLKTDSHRTNLEVDFDTQINAMVTDHGFKVIESSIRFTPIEPINIASQSYKDIAKIFIEWDKIKQELELHKKENQYDFEHNVKKLEAEKASKANQDLREFEKKEKENELKNIQELASTEKSIAVEKNNLEKELGEQRKILENYFNSRQEEKDTYAHNLVIDKIMKKKLIIDEEDKIEKQKIENAFHTETKQLEHDESLLDKKIDKLSKIKEITNYEMEIEKVQGLLKNELELLKVKNTYYIENEILLVISKLIEQLPEIVKNLPREKVGDTTLINIGDNDKLPDLKLSGIFGFSLLPSIKNFINEFSNKLKKENSNSNSLMGS